jgi:hypothetical protein
MHQVPDEGTGLTRAEPKSNQSGENIERLQEDEDANGGPLLQKPHISIVSCGAGAGPVFFG